MRKSERRLSAAEALEIMDKAPYITVSFIRPDGSPYGLPLSLARTDGRTFYFHCAMEGEKLECIKANPMVSLSAVSRCTPKFEDEKQVFTCWYRSATAIGKAETVTDDKEKTDALRAICKRFLPKNMDAFDAAVERSLGRTCVVKITLTEEPVGKYKGI